MPGTDRVVAQQRNVDPRVVFEEPRPRSYADLRMAHFGRGPLDRVLEPCSEALIELEDRGGPAFIAYYTQIAQHGSQGSSDNWTANQELDAYALWHVHESPVFGTSDVYAYFYHIEDNFTGTDTREFTDAVGSVWETNYNEADGVFNSLDVLVWQQSWNDGQVEVLVGQMDPGVFFDLNLYAGDDTGYFYAEPLATNPTRAFPLAGLGVMLRTTPVDWLEVFGAVSDGDPDGRYPDFESLGDGRWFFAGEIVLKPRISGLPGNYRLTGYGIDSTETRRGGHGWALSLDQLVTSDYGVFFRFGHADGRRRDVRTFVNVGAVCLAPFGWKDDRVGLGFVWGRPTDPTERDQYGIELFYRWQLTARMEFSPDLQCILDPSRTPDRDVVVVGGCRLRWTF